jgi:hypothetical protein
VTGPVIVASAAWYAERAVLGAVVRRPELATGSDVLAVEEFAHPEHAAVWAAVLGLQREAEHVSGPDDVALAPAALGRVLDNAAVVSEALVSRRFSETDVVHPSRLMYELIAVAPSNIFEVALYARIVREAAARRRLDELGLRPASADTDISRDISAGSLTSQEIADRKRVLGDVYRSARQQIRAAHLGVSPASDLADPTTPLPRRLVERQEYVLIRAMLIDPAARERNLLELFQPGDFGLAKCVAAWRAMQIVSERQDLLTPITVAWEAEKLSPGALTVVELTAMTREPPRELEQAIVVVARAAWTRYNDAPGLPGARTGEDPTPHAVADHGPHNVASPVDQERKRTATTRGPAATTIRGWLLPDPVPSQEHTR